MNNEKLQRWALIAEIASGFGVLVTLIILLFEVRENTEIARMSAYQQEIEAISDWRFRIITDPELSRVYTDYTNDSVPDINSEDGIKLRFLILNLFAQFESAYNSREAGMLGDIEWERMQRSICRLYGDVLPFPEYWENSVSRLGSNFSAYVTQYCN